ncbi:LAME_0F06700g1_1 [Lachancea meyersii CBS 8951]|uniref:DNA 3'-5' helicase n=1 Tax=Lachancea meyersii CBS 8951 TaxID=1266667 RepID=A0A1G4JTK6_9SACH|nr:LAME_0F06700g1_1 [Lachancea meyersii CBS 8951]
MIEPTPSQKEVINSEYAAGTTIKVIAGPGSGKTLTLMLKVRELITSGTLKPDEVLILSLTNKAVDNAVHKLLDVFQENEPCEVQTSTADIVTQINVSTIHGLANRVVVENEGLINIIEENGWRGLLKLIPPDILKNFGRSKSGTALTPRMFERLFREYQVGGKNRVQDSTMERIISIMRGSKVVTNDELIVLAAKYLDLARNSSKPESSASFTQDLLEKYKVVVVDEFQDLFPSLLPFLEIVARGKQLILFGDPHQSIYGFLGDNKILMQSLEESRSTRAQETYYLFDNFRSTPEISQLSSALIKENDKSVGQAYYSKLPMSLQCQAIKAADSIEELEIVVREVCRVVSHSARFSDIAILTRTNAQLNFVAEYLGSYGIPVEKLTAQPDWMSDKTVKFLSDLLKLCVLVSKEQGASGEANHLAYYPSDFSVIVTLGASKGVSNQALQALFAEAKASKVSLWDVLAQGRLTSVSTANKNKIRNYVKHVVTLMEQLELDADPEPVSLIATLADTASKLGFVSEGIKSAEAIDASKCHISEWLKALKGCIQLKPENVPYTEWILETQFDQIQAANQFSDSSQDRGIGSVKLSTIHSSKGLEFPIVFLLGSSDSTFPIEKNALYVGITRARNILYLSNVSNKLLPAQPLCGENIPWNAGMWKYYRKDLKRPCVTNFVTSSNNFNFLSKRYGLASPVRSISTFAVRASHSLRYVIR